MHHQAWTPGDVPTNLVMSEPGPPRHPSTLGSDRKRSGSHPAHPDRSHQIGAVTVEPDATRRRREGVMPSEVTALDPALTPSGHCKQSTSMAAGSDQPEELAERANARMLGRIYWNLVDGDNRSRMAAIVGARDQEGARAQFADADDRLQEPESVQLAGEGSDSVHAE
jgi:hypothetical protein